jgi:hypothetical protein
VTGSIESAPNEIDPQRLAAQLVRQLVGQARAEGVELVGYLTCHHQGPRAAGATAAARSRTTS